ncbi:hypothetical protein OG806_47395 [Streptomyces sp. NBC_00882]|nr:hypothetical protein OG806_47395 [Streptomyces sp. NBC_00882]WSZ63431.1 hypothetical protein OH824_46250 [Streptomyces canus]
MRDVLEWFGRPADDDPVSAPGGPADGRSPAERGLHAHSRLAHTEEL